ncbi:MAG: ribbon-helix-helix protein, CopG family [Chloroflexi bacterium]|nr:ribbon-helix-helix protein, CopG family [Chloroflexota bacterium]
MVKKGLSVEIPEELLASLNELAKRTGRKKTILVGASLHEFLEAGVQRQEEIVIRYLNAEPE